MNWISEKFALLKVSCIKLIDANTAYEEIFDDCLEKMQKYLSKPIVSFAL